MKKRILIIMYVLLLCVTVSFAWLSNIQETSTESVSVDFNNAMITDLEFNANLEIDPSYCDAEHSGEGIRLSEKVMIPNARIPFKINIDRAENEKKAKLFLDLAIDCSEDETVEGIPMILDKIYVDIVFTERSIQYPNGRTRHVLKKLSEFSEKDGFYGDFSVELFGVGEEIIVGSIADENNDKQINDTESVLTLSCSLFYDNSATAEYQEMGIDAMLFRLER